MQRRGDTHPVSSHLPAGFLRSEPRETAGRGWHIVQKMQLLLRSHRNYVGLKDVKCLFQAKWLSEVWHGI